MVPRGSTVGVTQETAIPCSETMWFLCGSTWFQAPVLNLVRTQTKRHVSAFEKPSRIIISKIGKRLARRFPILLIIIREGFSKAETCLFVWVRTRFSTGAWNHVEPHRNHMVSEHGIAVSCVTPTVEPRGTTQEPHGF